MPDLKFKLRRSPRTLLERDGHPGPGPGHVGLVLGRHGVGKTAFLVGIGIDAMLSGQDVLHLSLGRTVDRIRAWYDEILHEALDRQKALDREYGLRSEIERHRHIHTYLARQFGPKRLRDALDLLGRVDFKPQVILIDRWELDSATSEQLKEVHQIAESSGAELWLTCSIHRDGPDGAPGHLPPPADRFESSIDLAIRLDPHSDRVRLHVLKDRQEYLDEDMNVLLDPHTLLLKSGARR